MPARSVLRIRPAERSTAVHSGGPPMPHPQAVARRGGGEWCHHAPLAPVLQPAGLSTYRRGTSASHARRMEEERRPRGGHNSDRLHGSADLRRVSTPPRAPELRYGAYLPSRRPAPARHLEWGTSCTCRARGMDAAVLSTVSPRNPTGLFPAHVPRSR